MGLFNAIANRVRKASNDAEKKVRDPIADSEAAIEDSKKLAIKFQNDINEVVAKNKRLTRERDEAKDEVKKYENLATKALQAGNDNDARQLLELQEQKQKVLDTLNSEVKTNDKLIGELRSNLTKIQTKISSAEQNQTRLEARLQNAKIREGIAASSSSLLNSEKSPLAALDALEDAVDEAECSAEAMEETIGLEAGNIANSLEDKYSGDTSSVDDKLAKLKAKIGQ